MALSQSIERCIWQYKKVIAKEDGIGEAPEVKVSDNLDLRGEFNEFLASQSCNKDCQNALIAHIVYHNYHSIVEPLLK